jgi:mono/diheme cytochrome c family protein
MLSRVAFALSLLFCAFNLAHAQQNRSETRGELLYSTHCVACHTTEIHWREKRLVKNISSLRFQVNRWQATIGLNWTKEEIADVAVYLNSTYYKFKDFDQKGLGDGKKPLQAFHEN